MGCVDATKLPVTGSGRARARAGGGGRAGGFTSRADSQVACELEMSESAVVWAPCRLLYQWTRHKASR